MVSRGTTTQIITCILLHHAVRTELTPYEDKLPRDASLLVITTSTHIREHGGPHQPLHLKKKSITGVNVKSSADGVFRMPRLGEQLACCIRLLPNRPDFPVFSAPSASDLSFSHLRHNSRIVFESLARVSGDRSGLLTR